MQFESRLNVSDFIYELKIKTAIIINFEISLTQIRSNVEKIKEKQNVDLAQHAKQKIELIKKLQSIFRQKQSTLDMMNETKKIKKFK